MLVSNWVARTLHGLQCLVLFVHIFHVKVYGLFYGNKQDYNSIKRKCCYILPSVIFPYATHAHKLYRITLITLPFFHCRSSNHICQVAYCKLIKQLNCIELYQYNFNLSGDTIPLFLYVHPMLIINCLSLLILLIMTWLNPHVFFMLFFFFVLNFT